MYFKFEAMKIYDLKTQFFERLFKNRPQPQRIRCQRELPLVFYDKNLLRTKYDCISQEFFHTLNTKAPTVSINDARCSLQVAQKQENYTLFYDISYDSQLSAITILNKRNNNNRRLCALLYLKNGINRIIYDRTSNKQHNADALLAFIYLMKSNKYSLLENNTHTPLHREDDMDREYPTNYQHPDTPYSQLREDTHPTLSHYKPKQNIQMTQFGRQQSRPQTASLKHSSLSQNYTNSTIQKQKYSHSSYMHQINQMPNKTVYHIPSQYKGSVVHLNPNGMVIQPRVPFIPPVVVDCESCQVKQQIPGDADQYYCCSCQKLNQTQPKFGLFICGVCRQKVCYPYRTSDHIQCNICYSINIVPLYPPNYAQVAKSKQYQKLSTSQLNQSELILPKQLREVEPLQRPIQDDEITTVRYNMEQREQFQK